MPIMPITLNTSYLKDFINENEFEIMQPYIKATHDMLHAKSGVGNEFLGWLDLPSKHDKEIIQDILETAEKIRSDSQALIVIGIGGSYLGARSAIELLKSPMHNLLNKDETNIYFIGNNLSPQHIKNTLALCDGKDVSVNVISKSGTTTEPAIAFRLIKEFMEKKYGEEAKNRIYCTTDKSKGVLKQVADENEYKTFVIPDNIGGRFSVLTAVGLLPIAVAGIDINKIMHGAAFAESTTADPDIEKNNCYKYASIRKMLYDKGKSVELFVSYEPSFSMISEWLKQLFGESEGKLKKGLFPSSVNFSTDLHSLGQFIQQGSPIMFETVFNVKSYNEDLFIKEDETDFDGLNFLANQNLSEINRKALKATASAHIEGGIPNIIFDVDSVNEFSYGYFVYFFEKACAMSAYLLGVNPFDQPGVEDYKIKMFKLLGKPGY